MSLAKIIAEIDGVEFYTDRDTGKSGISQTGLALLCGVNRRTISDLIKSLSGGSRSKWLEPIAGKVADLSVKTPSGMILLADEICTAIIKHYAFGGNETAQFALDKFVTIGFNTWVQSITGWQTPQPPEPAKLPWTPPELYPDMSEETFNALPPGDRNYFLESPHTRAMRQQAESYEMKLFRAREAQRMPVYLMNDD